MKNYLTLSYDYSHVYLKNQVILYNNLDGRVFTVEGKNANILHNVISGAYESELREKHGSS